MESNNSSSSSLHIAMYPWFAVGHITPYLHFANKLAQKGHKISFLIPTKTQLKFHHMNLFPDLITFVPITVPHVDGLPPGAETTYDVPPPLYPLIMTAMDRTEPDIQRLLQKLKPRFVLFDFTYWIPKLARGLGIASMYYSVVSAVTVAYSISKARHLSGTLSEDGLMQPPPGFPGSSITLHRHEARASIGLRATKFGGDVYFYDRIFTGLSECDAIGLKACREIDGLFVDFLERDYGKPVLISGPVLPSRTVVSLEEKWANWLGGFESNSVVFCALGSEVTLSKEQFRELLLGFELSGFPFLAVLRPPQGAESVEEAIPEGFEERVRGRGLVHQGWIQQQQILEHSSIGCFVTHCGCNLLFEALVNKCELVFLPCRGDHVYNARLMGKMLKVGIEVEKGEEDGLFTRKSICEAIKTVMEGEVGREIRANRAELRKLLLRQDLESSYVDEFSEKLQALL